MNADSCRKVPSLFVMMPEYVQSIPSVRWALLTLSLRTPSLRLATIHGGTCGTAHISRGSLLLIDRPERLNTSFQPIWQVPHMGCR
jgi:hypothetical protein